MTARTAETLDAVFGRLHAILDEHEDELAVTVDEAGEYELHSTKPHDGQDLYFGGVHVRKRYVSYYLFPVYMFPDLLEDVSPELRKRMQGKSCFNFTKVDDDLFTQLARLTDRGLERFRTENLV